jgi:putative ABC transport system permease protein
MRAALSLTLAYRHVRSAFGRMALSIVAVALGVALVVAIRLMNTAVLQSFLDAVDAVGGRAALTITARDNATFPEEVAKTAAQVRGVKLAVPLVTGVAFPDDSTGELLTVHGVDFGHEAEVRLYDQGNGVDEILDDPLVFLNDPRSIVLTREFAARRGLTVGQQVPLVTPTGVKDFVVRGLLEPQGVARALGGRLVVMDLYAAQRAFAADGQINQVDLVLDPGVDLAATRTALTAALPPGLEVQEPALRKEVVRDGVAAFQSMLTAFGLLAVVAGFVICYSRLGAIFEARTWEVGLLRAGGLRRSVVFRELLKESVLLGAAGAALGIPLGVLVARVGLPFLATTTAFASNLPVPEAKLGLTSPDILLGLALGIGAAVAAAAVPALRMSRTHPVAALTMRGREMPSPVALPKWRWALFLLVAVVALLAAQGFSGVQALGFVTTALIVLSARMLATPLAGYGSRVLKPLWNASFGPAGRVAESHLARQPRRTALTVATLGIGLGSVLMLSILGWSFERSLVSTLTRWYRAQLIVTSVFTGGGHRSAPMSDEVVSKLQDVPGIAIAAGEQQREVGYGDDSILVVGFDPPCFLDHRVCDWPVDDGDAINALRAVANGNAVAVSRSFATAHRTRPGDRIELTTLNGARALTVAAITSGVSQKAVLMSRTLYRQLWNDDLVTWIHVAVTQQHDSQAVAAAIADKLGRKYRLRVLTSAAMIDYFASQVRQAFGLQYVMEAITLLLVLIGIGDTLAAGVASRTREIGMMRAAGVRRGSIFQIVLLEGAGIAVMGLLLAGMLGFALGIFWVHVQFPAILGWNLELHPPTIRMLIMAAITILLCLGGSLLPAFRAARLAVPAALRDE